MRLHMTPAPPVAALMTLVLFMPPAMAADALPSADELQAMADARQWPELLKATTRVLALKGDPAAAYDRIAIWQLKAEAQLHSSQFVPAAESFEEASEEPAVTPDQVDWCYAMSVLARKSDRRGYKPEATRDDPSPRAYDILQPEQRKEAISTLFKVEAADLDRRLEKLRSALPPRPTIEFLKQVERAQRLERAGTGSADRTGKMQSAVAEAFVATTEKWNRESLEKIEAIRAKADELIQVRERERVRVPGKDRKAEVERVRLRKRGLDGAGIKELKALMGAAERAADNYRQIEQALPETARPRMEPAKPLVQGVYDQAERTLTTDYSVERGAN